MWNVGTCWFNVKGREVAEVSNVASTNVGSCCNGSGAKGLRYSARINCQPVMGGAIEFGKVI